MIPETETDWQKFRAVRSMIDHWARPGWAPGREAYYWYLTFDTPELIALVERCQAELRLPYLDPVPLDRLHLTLPRVGWADDVPDPHLAEIVEKARTACARIPAFPLTVGPLAGSPGAVRSRSRTSEPRALGLSAILPIMSDGGLCP